MSLFPNYAILKPQWQADCNNWNASISAINYYLLVFSSPPIFLRLFNNRYNTFKDLKAELDAFTKSAGWLM
jgi:hypothetical protein